MTLCLCGCGGETTVYRGAPRRFVAGHHARGPLNPRFGKPCSEELKAKISQIRREQGNPWWVGRQHTEEFRKRMSERRRGVATTPRRGREVPCGTCKKLIYLKPHEEGIKQFCSRRCMGIATSTGERNPFYGRKHTEDTKDKIRKSALKQRATGCALPTKPERLVHEALTQLGVEYSAEYPIEKWCVDIWIPRHNLIIFVDGCYWHSCPAHFPGKRQPKTDNARIPYLTKAGYRVSILWEHEVLADSAGCTRRALGLTNV